MAGGSRPPSGRESRSGRPGGCGRSSGSGATSRARRGMRLWGPPASPWTPAASGSSTRRRRPWAGVSTRSSTRSLPRS
eukprot:10323533-Lingulodinium_polyedra.AAC.1